ncbi:MAG: hypothetical protein WC552_01080 [Candidatus Omnitrophota bacterium]
MTSKKTGKQVFPLLRQSINALVVNPIILFPFLTIAFFQLVILEILYFSTRFPLVAFFGPLIRRLWGEGYLHYPFNFAVLPMLFQFAQIPIYIFVSSFLIAVAMVMIAAINNDQNINFRSACRKAFPQYVHIVLAAIISFVIFYVLSKIYGVAIWRALKIGSKSGIFFMIKMIVLRGAPYFNLLMGVVITTLFAFVLPIIVIEKKKILSALILNFKSLWRSWWFIFLVVLFPTLLYVPVLILRNNMPVIANTFFPGIKFLALILSVLFMVVIDGVVYTAITMFYLLKRENQ